MEKTRIDLACELLKEAERLYPPKTQDSRIQICEKLWGAWAQATKAYKDWKSQRGYSLVINELYNKYPQYREIIRNANATAGYLHSYGFYEAVYLPVREDIEVIEKGIKIIKKIIANNVKYQKRNKKNK